MTARAADAADAADAAPAADAEGAAAGAPLVWVLHSSVGGLESMLVFACREAAAEHARRSDAAAGSAGLWAGRSRSELLGEEDWWDGRNWRRLRAVALHGGVAVPSASARPPGGPGAARP